jgi:hypothetical protein
MNIKAFFRKAKENKASTVIQVIILLLFIAIPFVAFLYKQALHCWRWVMFGIATILTIVQCIRLKHPLLLIDRIFANHAGKQLVLAFFAFIFTIDLALCIFPNEGIRSSFAGIISYVYLTHSPDDDYHFRDNPDSATHPHGDYKIIKDPKPIYRWDYFKHVIMYCLGLIVFNGLLIATINRFMATRAERYKKGANTYKSLRNHYVIIGYGPSCVPIIRNIFNRHDTDPSVYFLILSNQNIEAIRRDIQTQLPDVEEKIVIYSGNMDSESQLNRLNIGKTKEAYILGEGHEAGRDSKNLECAKTVKEIREKGPIKSTLHLNMQFDKPSSYSTIKRITIPKKYYKNDNGDEVTYLRPFNFYENWARLLWGTYKLDEYKTLDQGLMVDNDPKKGQTLAQRHVHLVIAGFNEMGEALLLEALRICHYPNYDEATGANKTQITIVDPNMDKMLPRFKSQYPYLDQIADVEIDYKACQLEDEAFSASLSDWAAREDTVLTVAICHYDSDESLSAALSLPDPLYYQVAEGKVIPNVTTQILARQEIRSGLTKLLDEENGKYANVKIFGMPDKGVDDTLLDDKMAIFINAYYHFKYDLSQDFFEQVKIDKGKAFAEAARNWIALNEDKRFANRYQTEVYKTYQTYRPLLDQHPDLLYQTEHMRWCAERSITGYRDMHEANLKNGAYQLHNLIVPYHDLSDHEKGKDKDVLEIMDKVITLSKEIKEEIV